MQSRYRIFTSSVSKLLCSCTLKFLVTFKPTVFKIVKCKNMLAQDIEQQHTFPVPTVSELWLWNLERKGVEYHKAAVWLVFMVPTKKVQFRNRKSFETAENEGAQQNWNQEIYEETMTALWVVSYTILNAGKNNNYRI